MQNFKADENLHKKTDYLLKKALPAFKLKKMVSVPVAIPSNIVRSTDKRIIVEGLRETRRINSEYKHLTVELLYRKLNIPLPPKITH